MWRTGKLMKMANLNDSIMFHCMLGFRYGEILLLLSMMDDAVIGARTLKEEWVWSSGGCIISHWSAGRTMTARVVLMLEKYNFTSQCDIDVCFIFWRGNNTPQPIHIRLAVVSIYRQHSSNSRRNHPNKQSTIHQLFPPTLIQSVILGKRSSCLLTLLGRQELKHCHWMDFGLDPSCL